MMRQLALAAGLGCAAAFSQFPEFSQQYLQRLSGAVDELKGVVFAFDAAAMASGLSREAALAELSGTTFQTELQSALASQITRYEALHADYTALSQAEPLGRLAHVYRFTDPDLARRTWEEFRPAVPVTSDGLICAGLGYFVGWSLLSGLMALISKSFRRHSLRGRNAV